MSDGVLCCCPAAATLRLRTPRCAAAVAADAAASAAARGMRSCGDVASLLAKAACRYPESGGLLRYHACAHTRASRDLPKVPIASSAQASDRLGGTAAQASPSFGGKERSKPRLSCHMVLVSSSSDPSTAGGHRIHVHAYARRALRSQVWCPLQALPPLGLPSTSVYVRRPRAGMHALPPL